MYWNMEERLHDQWKYTSESIEKVDEKNNSVKNTCRNQTKLDSESNRNKLRNKNEERLVNLTIFEDSSKIKMRTRSLTRKPKKKISLADWMKTLTFSSVFLFGLGLWKDGETPKLAFQRVEKNTLRRDWNSAGLKVDGAARRNFVPILATGRSVVKSAHARRSRRQLDPALFPYTNGQMGGAKGVGCSIQLRERGGRRVGRIKTRGHTVTSLPAPI